MFDALLKTAAKTSDWQIKLQLGFGKNNFVEDWEGMLLKHPKALSRDFFLTGFIFVFFKGNLNSHVSALFTLNTTEQ